MLLRLPMLLARYLNNGRLKLLFLALICLLLVGIYFAVRREADIRCYIDTPQMVTEFEDSVSNTNSPLPRLLEDVLQAEPKPIPGRSIFFHETSCHKPKRKKQRPGQSPEFQYNMLKLTARQACAIESAALHNPNFLVYVLFASPTYRYRDNSSEHQQPLVDAILSYSNVQLRRLNLWRYAAGTPIEEWLNDGQLFRSSYLFSHISDFLRYVTLYRFGGIYLDMDVVVLRSMEDVPPNYTGAESSTDLAAGVMSFAATGIGHDIAGSCLRDFQQNFDGSDWGNNGPGVITRVAQKVCNTMEISQMVENSKRCLGFKVFDRNAFYAVPWTHWRHFFEPQLVEQTLAHTKDSYLVHVWNKHSKELSIKVGSSSAYGKYAELNCPKAYAAAGEYF